MNNSINVFNNSSTSNTKTHSLLNNFKLFHINIQSLRNKYNELEAFLLDSGKDYDAICLSEHWLFPQEIINFTFNNHIVASHFSRSIHIHGGVLILLKSSLQFLPLVNINDLSIEMQCEICAVEVVRYNLILITIYRQPKGDMDVLLNILHQAFNLISPKRDIILCGDFNVQFGTNHRDCFTICDFLESNGFERMIHENTRLANCIDNIFINFKNDNSIANVIDANLSDHKGQEFTTNFCNNASTKIKTPYRPITLKGKLLLYDKISEIRWDFTNGKQHDINTKFNIFHNRILSVFETCFPIKYRIQSTCQSDDIIWFNNSLRNMREHLSLLNDLYNQYKTPEMLLQRNQFRNQYRHALRNTRIEAHDAYIKKSNNSSKSMWKIVNSFRNKKTQDIPDIEANEFNIYFNNIPHKIVTDIPNSQNSPLDYLHNFSHTSNFTLKEVTINEVRDIIDSLSNTNSRDIYGFPTEIIKYIKNFLVIPLTHLINACFREGIFPDALKKALIIPLYKKGNRNDPASYRPISILPIISKIFEKAIKIRITDYFENNNLFNEAQFGFRSCKSTSDAILDLVESILNSFNQNEIMSAAFCDLTKAFDCVRHDILLEKLKYYGFDRTSIDLIQSYLCNRTQAVSGTGDVSDELEMTVGVPQGSILGPVLFLIFINDLPLCTSANFVLFADDTTFTNSGDDLLEVLARCHELQRLSKDWFDANKLCLNSAKTENMVFSLRHLDDSDSSKSVKFLGVYLDSTLKWEVHTNNLASKLCSNIYLLNTLSNVVSTNVLKSAYFALVHSLISYAIVAWGHATSNDRIFRLQRRSIRIISRLGFRDDCRSAFILHRIMTLPCIYIFNCIIFVKTHQFKYKSHQDIHSYPTRNNKKLCPEYVRLKKCQNSPNFMGIKFFNVLPETIRELDIKLFKSKLKLYLISKSFYTLEEYLQNDFSDM